MYRILFLLNTLFIAFPVFAQTPQANLQKYWIMRNRLIQNFMAMSTTPVPATLPSSSDMPVTPTGTSIPAACLGLLTTPGTNDNSWTNVSGTNLVTWEDGNGTMQWYIGVLATEYALLQNYGQDVSATRQELYNALLAVYRLDLTAETYWNNDGDNFNGFLIRDDIKYEIYYNNNNLCPYDISDNTGPTGGNPSTMAESEDVIWNYLPNLALVTKLVNDPVITPLAAQIAYNMVKYLNSNSGLCCWQMVDPNGNPIDDNHGGMVDVPCGISVGLDYGFATAGDIVSEDVNHTMPSLQSCNSNGNVNRNEFISGVLNSSRYEYLTLASIIGTNNGTYYNGTDLYGHLLSNTNSNADAPYEHLPLVYTILNGEGAGFVENWASTFASYQNLLNLCPSCGPFNYNGALLNGTEVVPPWQWSSPNRFLWPPPSNALGKNGSYGNYSGLDYMLLHNLVWLAYIAPESPPFENFFCPIPPFFNEVRTIGTPQAMEFDCSVGGGSNISLQALNSITLNPGFSVESGSVFNADIVTTLDGYPIFQDLRSSNPSNCLPSGVACTRSSRDDAIVISSSNKPLKDTLSKANTSSSMLPNTISIYPNPTNSNEITITVQLNSNEASTIEITNLLGSTVLSGIYTGNTINLQLPNLTSGVYIVNVKTKYNSYTQKLVVQK